ncbi:MAG TPA: vWA domain-containing protein [Kofleriaceae bacterium]
MALALWLKPWQSHSLVEPLPVPASAHRVDLVFAVDTTGSMGGLLDGAKRTVWSIASHIRQVDPDVDLRVGLVAYRDLGDEYVTKDLPLTTDLDAVFTELSGYIAAGGGDEPEDVDAALWDAVHKMAWRGDTKKMIFLVGDAPPASRNDVPRFEVSARDAHDRQIILNAIRCGNAEDTAVAWKQIAALGDGEFSSIAEDGGVQQVATPYDAKLADLSRTIDSTTVIYGAPAVHAHYAAKMAATAAAPAASKADRATYYAAKPSPRAAEDITEGVATGDMGVGGLDDNKLPSDLRGLSKDELKQTIADRARQRADAQKQMADVAKQRDEYLKSHAAAGSGFDGAVKGTVDRELAK